MKILLILTTVLLSTTTFAKDLILSTDLMIDYPEPILISHTQTSLILKYNDWSLTHEIVNPKGIYQFADLTGVTEKFIISIFDEGVRKTLPSWLAALSSDQANAFSITRQNTKKQLVGSTKILSVYDEKRSNGYLYLIEKLKIHHIVVHGSVLNFNMIINNIKER